MLVRTIYSSTQHTYILTMRVCATVTCITCYAIANMPNTYLMNIAVHFCGVTCRTFNIRFDNCDETFHEFKKGLLNRKSCNTRSVGNNHCDATSIHDRRF